MARVDHKKIKQLIAQKKKTVTDRQLFTSRAMAAHFEDMAAAHTRRYGYRRRVKVKLVWKPKELASAKTDNSRIWLNAGHASVTQCKSRQERYEQICGMFAHELGHVVQSYRDLKSSWWNETMASYTSYRYFCYADEGALVGNRYIQANDPRSAAARNALRRPICGTTSSPTPSTR